MRNLKKILALVLALVLSLSLVTIASGADFNDADEIELTEAVDVMTAIGVLEGHNTGDFAPQGTLTREQAAKIITYMLLGDSADRLSVASTSFSDVAANHWSAADIEYCTTLGIIAGYGDGRFNPSGTLTGYAFAKMLLTAIGYDAEIENLTGAGWTINVSRLALQVGLDDGIEDISWGSSITREQAAQMALNAIKTPLVQYDNGVTVIVNGEPVTFGSGDAYYVTTTLAREQRISDATLSNTNDIYTVEFGERYFPRLILTDDVTDEFGRPAHIWTYETEDIGTYTDLDLLLTSYETGVSYKDVGTDIGYSIVKQYDLYAFVDGAEMDHTAIKDAIMDKSTDDMTSTGRGVLTEVYVDHDAEEINIVMINTYLALVTNNYDEKDGELPIDVYYTITGGTEPLARSTPKDVSIDDVANASDFSKDDYVLVTLSAPDHKGNNTLKDYTVRSVADPEVLSEVSLTSYTTDTHSTADTEQERVTSVTTNGTKYYTAEKSYEDAGIFYNYNETLDNLKGCTYNLYLDPYGNVIGVEEVVAADTYIFVAGYESTSSVLAQAIDKALIITTEGEIKGGVPIVDDKLDDAYKATWEGIIAGGAGANGAVNQWFTYTMDGDTYVLKAPVDQIHDTSYENISGLRTSLSEGSTVAYGNADTVYITVDADYSIIADSDSARDGYTDGTDNGGSIVEVNGIATGVKNVDIQVWDTDQDDEEAVGDESYGWTNDAHGVYAMYNDNGYVTYAVVVGEEVGSTSNMIYFTSNPTGRFYDADLGDYYVTYDAIVDGAQTTVKVVDEVASLAGGPSANELHEGRFNSDGYVVKLTEKDDTADGHMNTSDNKDNGYAMKGQDTVYTADDPIALTLKGFTLWVETEEREDNYVVVNDEARVFAKLYNEDEYDEYTDVDAAIAALDSEKGYVAQVTAICSGTTGYADTLIIREVGIDETDDVVIEDLLVDISDRDDVKVNYIGEDTPHDFDDCIAAIEAEIEKTGYTVESIVEDESTANTWIFNAVKGKLTVTYKYNANTAPVRMAKVNWEFSHNNDNWSFEGPDYVAYAGDDVTGTLTCTKAPQAGTYTINSVTGATVKTAAAFDGSEKSANIVFTISACSSDEITVTLQTVKKQ